MTYLLAGLAVLVAYYALCAYVTYGRGNFGFSYNPLIAWCLVKMGRPAITIGSTCYVRYRHYLHVWYCGMHTKLYRHEIVHYRQWQRRPFTFLPEYLWKQITKGHGHNYMEDDARKAE
jgi:hypothetical protein